MRREHARGPTEEHTSNTNSNTIDTDIHRNYHDNDNNKTRHDHQHTTKTTNPACPDSGGGISTGEQTQNPDTR